MKVPKALSLSTASPLEFFPNASPAVDSFLRVGSGVPSADSLERYKSRAQELLAGAVTPSERNRAITGAYAALFLKKPDVFLWAGMASFASNYVGYGILMPACAPRWEALAEETAFSLREKLVAGNEGVYRDIFPLFLAYLEGGAAAVRALPVDERLKTGFALLEIGETARREGNAEQARILIHQGNKALLRYEQEVTLQELVYDGHSQAWQILSPALSMHFDSAALPDPRRSTLFYANVPGGNIALFENRWDWIENAMLPLWENLAQGDSRRVGKDLKNLRKSGETAKGSPYGL